MVVKSLQRLKSDYPVNSVIPAQSGTRQKKIPAPMEGAVSRIKTFHFLGISV